MICQVHLQHMHATI